MKKFSNAVEEGKHQKLTKIFLCLIAAEWNNLLPRVFSMMLYPEFYGKLGTIAIAANYGPFYGVLTGLASNMFWLVSGVKMSPSSLVDVIISIAVDTTIGFIVGICSAEGFSLKKAFGASILIGFIFPMIHFTLEDVYWNIEWNGADSLDSVIFALRGLVDPLFWAGAWPFFIDPLICCLGVAGFMKLFEVKGSEKKLMALKLSIIAVGTNYLMSLILRFIPLLNFSELGTIYITAAYGINSGLTMVVVSMLLDIFLHGLPEIAYAFVHLIVVLVISLLRKNGFDYKRAIIAGIILALIYPRIRFAVISGIMESTAAVDISRVTLGLQIFAKEMTSEVYWLNFFGDLPDKIVSCLLVAGVIPCLKDKQAR